jgi:type I restriction enzyme S subunit
MERILDKINLNNLDKSNWESFRFEEIAFRVTEGVDPNTTLLEKYIGLEHIDPENIHVKRFGTPDDVSGGKLKCYPGDVIFGKRRAYQRKAAIVEFEGICSAHAFVFRANPEVIDLNLFPFFLHSDQFMNRAIDISVGGLSPTINWGDLKGQEFLLPPKADQARLAELLWAMDDVIEKETKVLEKFKKYLETSLKDIFQLNSKRIPLVDLCTDPPKYGANSPSTEFQNNIRYLRITDIGDFGELNLEKVSATIHEDKYLLTYGDLLLARTADPGRSYYYKPEDGICTHAGYLIKFRLNLNTIIPEYLYYFTQTVEFKSWINKTTRKGTISNINAAEFSKLKIPIAEIEKQKAYIQKIKAQYNLLKQVGFKLKSTQALQKSLFNHFF